MKLIFKKVEYLNINIFTFYILITILIFLGQKLLLPSQLGFSGDGGVLGPGYGTDDSYYYSRAVDQLPINFPIRPNLDYEKTKFDFYSYILSIVAKFLKIFGLNNFIDLIMFNSIILSFTPWYVYKITDKLFGRNSSVYALIMTTICPLLISDGLILIRDGFVATMSTAIIYYALNSKHILSIISIIIESLIRLASGLQGILIYFIYSILKEKKNLFNKILLTIVMIFISFIFYENILNYFGPKVGSNLLLREYFINQFLITADTGHGTLLKIQSLPFILRITLSMTFFFITPVLSFADLIYKNVFILRKFITSIYSIYFIFYIKYFFNALLISNKKKYRLLKVFNIIFMLLLFTVSVISLQMRHKTIYLPLFYIITSVGVENKSNISKIMETILPILMIVINIYVNIM